MHARLIASGLLAATSALPLAAFAEDAAPAAPTPPYTFTSNLSINSEYIYRGIGQTNRKPAFQGGFDLSHESGFYVGNWNSNISWLSDAPGGGVSAPIEMDFYGGYKGEIVKDLTFDVGGLEYYYPGSYPSGFVRPNTFEVYGALTYGPVTLKYSRSTTNLFGANSPTGQDTKGSGYIDLSYTLDLGDGLTAGAHLGHQTVKNFSDASYSDYKLSLGKDLSGSGYIVTGAIIGTNAKGDPGQFYNNQFGKDLGKTRFVISVGKTF